MFVLIYVKENYAYIIFSAKSYKKADGLMMNTPFLDWSSNFAIVKLNNIFK